MTILGIETSCDETALALLETREKSGVFECRVINSLVHSQAELHSAYGGVYPNLAKREHQKNLMPLLEKLLEPLYGNDFMEKNNGIDLIAVTEGPGLEPALWTGIVFAQELASKWKVPIVPIDHMEGHIVASLLESDIPQGSWQRLKNLPLPAIALLISGGHTQLININSIGDYEIVGETLDDAVGEAFDKVARLLGLPYPGGPHISLLANQARDQNIQSQVKLPRPMISSKNFDFSFSGLKTAVLYAVKKAQESDQFTDEYKKGLALEFEQAVSDVLDAKLRNAIQKYNSLSIIIGGGVSANHLLRQTFEKTANEFDIPIFLPSKHLSGDNALMIAIAGALHDKSSYSTELRAHGTKRLSVK
ncbi:MAG: tRNA (adenosine(37)-N6)-threonylcarbamoyltransferase complex transferase subunit TsaD [Candidatus Paceibacterota bacterium]|jgi:N6-L-threonylcarbamoyladenine synthase